MLGPVLVAEEHWKRLGMIEVLKGCEMSKKEIERAFRDLKSNLGLRPIYHQKEHRVDAHLFISVLAYHLLHAIEHTVR
ncbi:conserved hypothetical protein [Candidatus Brocadia pituitae]|nr:conserved hypothetical protein [Candidatus Brocadia pituitae]